MPSRGRRRARQEERLEELGRTRRFVHRPPVWFPHELQIKICREVVRSRIAEGPYKKTRILYGSRKLDEMIDYTMGPLRNKSHLRHDAAKEIVGRNNLFAHMSLSPHATIMPSREAKSYEPQVYEFDFNAALLRHTATLCISTMTLNTPRLSLETYSAWCTNFAARLRATFPSDSSSGPGVLTLMLDRSLGLSPEPVEEVAPLDPSRDLTECCVPTQMGFPARRRQMQSWPSYHARELIECCISALSGLPAGQRQLLVYGMKHIGWSNDTIDMTNEPAEAVLHALCDTEDNVAAWV
ncbi:hypothetical protein LTR65_008280 [Meristemomyces frigidus]